MNNRHGTTYPEAKSKTEIFLEGLGVLTLTVLAVCALDILPELIRGSI